MSSGRNGGAGGSKKADKATLACPGSVGGRKGR